MATEQEINIIADIILDVFDKDPAVFRSSLEAIRINTEAVTLENQIAAIRAEIAAFVEAKEAEIQALRGM